MSCRLHDRHDDEPASRLDRNGKCSQLPCGWSPPRPPAKRPFGVRFAIWLALFGFGSGVLGLVGVVAIIVYALFRGCSA